MPATRNEVRIIGGAWRGRKLRFPAEVPGLRPTPDRVRETVFNWLRDEVAGSRCLDLYAGSGALGLEALSRGAREVVFVDRDPRVVRYLSAALDVFGSNAGCVSRADAEAFLRVPGEPFDIVFLDPPFAAGLLPALVAAIDRHGWVRPGGLVYLEAAADQGVPTLPHGWSLHRSKRAGEVGYHLSRAAHCGATPGDPAAPTHS
jgi:16S rRNA (guanine966-N2)-methyltransferase